VPYATHIWQPADSSELNGSYKIALTKAKVLYQRSKQDNKKSFKPTDVIPLFNLAWADSFGRKELARKAILERGWLVLNYVLLDDDRLTNDTNNVEEGQCFVDDKNSREETEIDLERMRNMLRSINQTGTTYHACLDLVLTEERLCAGRQRAYLEAKAKGESKFAIIERLEKVGNITSAKLAVNGMHDLSDPTLLLCYGRLDEKARVEENRKEKNKSDTSKKNAAIY
jgi:hypothetical protein